MTRYGPGQYSCELCSTRYVVPSLARECEDKHLDDGLYPGWNDEAPC